MQWFIKGIKYSDVKSFIRRNWVKLEIEEYMTIERINGVRERVGKLRRQLLKYKDAEVVYSLTHRKLLEMVASLWSVTRYIILLCFTLLKTGSIAKSVLHAH